VRVVTGAVSSPPPDDQERFIALLIGEAQTQRAIQAGTTDGYDGKALGLVAVAVAGVTALLAARPGPVWLVATLLLAGAMVPLFLTLWLRDFANGPDLGAAYEQNIEEPAVIATAQLLGELEAAVEFNNRMLQTKARFLTWGFVALLLAGAVSGVLLSVLR
jgi:hypothetical protein